MSLGRPRRRLRHWWDTWPTSQILGIGQSIAGLSIFAGAIVVLLLLNVTVFLRHDYRGPLSGGSPQATS